MLNAKATLHDGMQRAATAMLESREQYHEEMWDRCLEKKKAGASSISAGEGSLRLSVQEIQCKGKKLGVLVFCSAVHDKIGCTLSMWICFSPGFTLE